MDLRPFQRIPANWVTSARRWNGALDQKGAASAAMRCLSRRVQILAFRYKPRGAIGCMLWQGWPQRGSNAMDKLVADIIVENLQSAGVKHCYGVVDDTLNLIAVRSIKAKSSGCRSDQEAGAVAVQAEAQVADRLTAVAGRAQLRWSAFHRRLAQPGRTRPADDERHSPLVKVPFPERGGAPWWIFCTA